MTALAIVTTLVGVVIITARGPLIFAPRATLRFYRKLLATDARIRIVGLAAAGLGLALASSAHASDGTTAAILAGFGWLIAGIGGLVMLLFPSAYRSFTESILEILEDGMRPIGIIGVAIGLIFVWTGLSMA
jgi:uncharacterized protein YjeT (DUF2065 family)